MEDRGFADVFLASQCSPELKYSSISHGKTLLVAIISKDIHSCLRGVTMDSFLRYQLIRINISLT